MNALVRAMVPGEIGIAVEWAAREGWNPGLHDASAFALVDPEGWFVAEVGGTVVGCISAPRYDDAFAFVGFYIVAPEHRGNGYGMALWNAAMAHARGCVVGLDGVVAQIENYARSGFVLDARNARYRGPGGGLPIGATGALEAADAEDVIAYDRSCFPAPREAFLRAWLSLPDSRSRVARRNGAVAGYATIRRCREGWKVGPLFADDARTAEALFADLCAGAPGEPVFLDVPSANEAAVALARRRGMDVVFETARMYAGGRPAVRGDRVFGVTTFELG